MALQRLVDLSRSRSRESSARLEALARLLRELSPQQVTEDVVRPASQASGDVHARLDDLRAAAEDISDRSATIAEPYSV